MRVLVLGVLLGSCAAASGPREIGVDSLAGCYALELSPWSNAWPAEWSPPDTFRLDTLPARLPSRWLSGSRMLRPQVDAFASSRGGGVAAWGQQAPDSIWVAWIGAYMQVDLRLQTRRSGLMGFARASTDVLAPPGLEPHATANARRVKCPRLLAKPAA